MEVRHCKFCDNPASYAPIQDMEEFSIKVYFCHPCQAEYLFLTHDGEICKEPSSVSLYARINSKMYRWTIMANGTGQLWKVGKPGIPGNKKNEDMESVMHIEKMDNVHVTPQNIETRIRSWLTFL